ncbi:MAG: hydrogen gas-evolving membrane-bound hydrogenase subunit E [Acidimicrobiales bacterium]
MSPSLRRWLFFVPMGGLAAFYLWGIAGLPGFGHYPGPYGNVIVAHAVSQTHATGVVSAVNFDYRGIDTLGEEFILFVASAGVATVLRRLRRERQRSPLDEARDRDVPETSDAVQIVGVLLTGPLVLYGWFLASHAQTSPSGGFQGGVVLASAAVLVYLAGQYVTLQRFSPTSVLDAAEALGAGSFAAIGVSALAYGLAFLTDILPLGSSPGSVDSSGTIALISFFVGVEVAAAFVLIVAELLEQTLVVRQGAS